MENKVINSISILCMQSNIVLYMAPVVCKLDRAIVPIFTLKSMLSSLVRKPRHATLLRHKRIDQFLRVVMPTPLAMQENKND